MMQEARWSIPRVTVTCGCSRKQLSADSLFRLFIIMMPQILKPLKARQSSRACCLKFGRADFAYSSALLLVVIPLSSLSLAHVILH